MPCQTSWFVGIPSGNLTIEIVDFPIKNGDLNHSYVENYQRVYIYIYTYIYL